MGTDGLAAAGADSERLLDTAGKCHAARENHNDRAVRNSANRVDASELHVGRSRQCAHKIAGLCLRAHLVLGMQLHMRIARPRALDTDVRNLLSEHRPSRRPCATSRRLAGAPSTAGGRCSSSSNSARNTPPQWFERARQCGPPPPAPEGQPPRVAAYDRLGQFSQMLIQLQRGQQLDPFQHLIDLPLGMLGRRCP